MSRYRVEQNKRRQDSFDGAAPLEVSHCGNLKEAESEMNRLADGGQFYAAVFINGIGQESGECVMESEDAEVDDGQENPL